MSALGPLAVWVGAALLGGGLLAPPLGTLGAWWAFAGVLLGLVVLGAGRAAGPGGRLLALSATAVVLVVGGAGGVRLALLEEGPVARLARQRASAVVVARIAAEPRPSGDGWWAVARLTQVDDTRVRARVLLRGSDEPPVLGSIWHGRVLFRPLSVGGFRAFLRRQHVAAAIEPVSLRPRAPPGLLARSSELVRARVRDAASRALPRSHAGLAVGLVTGDTRLLPQDNERALRDTGLTHLVAVSGSNVALVIAGASFLLGWLPARGRRLALALVVAWFAFLTRWEPSVLRAAVMVGVVLMAQARGRLVDPRHALAGAVLVLVLVDPHLAGSIGLLLSAAATAGVLVLAPALLPRLRLLPRPVALLLAATVGAQLAVAPVLLAAAGDLPVASVPANLVAVPAAAAASAIASIAAVVAAVSPGAAAPILALARWPLAVVLGAADGLRWWGGVVSLARPVTVIAAVGVALWLLARSGHGRRAGAAVAAVAVSLALAPRLSAIVPPRGLVVTAIDVGQGEALLVESPTARLLVDAGTDETALRWLRAHGRRRLDLLVASHPHLDHVGGLPPVAERLRVAAMWLPGLPDEHPSVQRLLETASDRGVPVARPHAGQEALVGDLRIDVLGPPPGRPYRWTDREANETSLVLRISWRGRVALLTGDIEQAAQADLLRRPERLGAGLLTVPHHGAGTTDPAFLRAVAPRAAVVSVGRNNEYGHPSPDVLTALRGLGATVRRTDLEGTVRVPVPAAGPEFAPAPERGVPSIGSAHARPRSPLPHRGGRRPSPAPRGRAPPGPPALRRGGPRRRDRRRGRDRTPAGDAHGVAVRR